MNRKKRTEILLKGSLEVVTKLALEILNKYEITIIERPNNGLIMVKVRETARKCLFYLGEVFVTECKILIGDYMGLGIVKGQEPELAYYLAVIDAAYNAGLPETEAWATILSAEEDGIKQCDEAFKNKVLKTKVSFQTMDV